MPYPITRIASISFALLALPCFASAKAPARELVVDPDGVVAGSVEGKPMRFLLSPTGSKVPILGPDAAARAGLKPGWINVMAIVGPVRIKGHSGVVRYTAPGTALKRRIGWFERSMAPGFDGLLGPAAVSAPIVTFRLRPTAPGERQFRLPLKDDGYFGMGSLLALGNERIRIRWNLDERATLVSAATGAFLSQVHGGQAQGATVRKPITFGVERPFRRVQLSRVLAFGPFQISAIAVRAQADGPAEANADPDEILVTAKKKQKGGHQITLGLDAMANCSTLSFDKAKGEVRLSCR